MIRRLRARWRALFDRRGAEADLDDELRFHLDMETQYQMRMGHDESDARRRAHVEFGGIERYRDESRDARGVGAVEDLLRDVRIAIRSLRRTPGFTLVSILTVALGVGATTAVFSLVDGILLRPLPYPSADRLVRIYERSAKYPTSAVSGANFADIERRSKTLQSVAFTSGDWRQTILGLSSPIRVSTAAVSHRFFDVLGVRAEYGRAFLPGEGTSVWKPGQTTPVVVSDRFWRTALNERPDWGTMILHAESWEGRIVGIMPANFNYPAGVDIWAASIDDNPSRTSHNWTVIGRLAPHDEIGDTRAELDQMFGALKTQLGKATDAEGVTIRTLRESLTLKVKTLCDILLAAVAFVLLVACTNLASANLARGEAQQRELAVRTSLGAARWRLVRQLTTEKLVLCLAGGALGCVVAWMLVRMTMAFGPGSLPAFADVSIDGRVLAFGLAASIVTGLATGLLPALRVTSDLRGSIASGGGGSGRRAGFSKPLIATEIAFATILVIGAGLFVRSFATLLSEDPGYKVDHVVLGTISLPSATYANHTAWGGDSIAVTRFYSTLLTRLRSLPGVGAVCLVNNIPLGDYNPDTRYMIDGSTELTGDADYRVIDSAYFSTMGIRLLSGRIFTSADKSGAEHVVIVNKAAAEQSWPGVNPIGHRMRPPGMDLHSDVWLTVIGVVQDIRQDGLDRPVTPQMYVHYLQRPERLMGATIAVRTTEPAMAIPAIRSSVAEMDRNVLVEIGSMRELVDRSLAGRRFSMTVLSAFSVLALFLAGVGIYGVLAYAVAQRQREIGVRVALGSSRPRIGRLVVNDALAAVLPGLAIGLIGAWFATRLIRGMLYGIAPADPATFVATPLVILAVSVAASLWPAVRAAKVDPMLAMRAE